MPPGEDQEQGELDASVVEAEPSTTEELSATPRRATNIGGGGQADNTCDCAVVGLDRSTLASHSTDGSVAFVLALAACFARRKRID